jgi:hypothetical protein
VNGRYYQMHTPERYAGHVDQAFKVDFARSALLVVDIYGHGFSQPGAAKDHPSMDAVKNKVWDEVTLGYVRPALEASRLALTCHKIDLQLELTQCNLEKSSANAPAAGSYKTVGIQVPGYCSPPRRQATTSSASTFIAGLKTPGSILSAIHARPFCAGFDASVCLLYIDRCLRAQLRDRPLASRLALEFRGRAIPFTKRSDHMD